MSDYINTDSDMFEKHSSAIYINSVDPMNKYIDFGNYKLDLKQLKGGKLQFRSKNNYFVKGLENRRMTPNMKIIIDKFLSNQNISFDDINKLDDDEKNYLSIMAEKCGINDRLRLPSPLLTKQQQDINKFNLLRGQICAGNDNMSMIKDFKILLLKLMNSGHVDKKEGQLLMITLLELGY